MMIIIIITIQYKSKNMLFVSLLPLMLVNKDYQKYKQLPRYINNTENIYHAHAVYIHTIN